MRFGDWLNWRTVVVGGGLSSTDWYSSKNSKFADLISSHVIIVMICQLIFLRCMNLISRSRRRNSCDIVLFTFQCKYKSFLLMPICQIACLHHTFLLFLTLLDDIITFNNKSDRTKVRRDQSDSSIRPPQFIYMNTIQKKKLVEKRKEIHQVTLSHTVTHWACSISPVNTQQYPS